MNEDLKKLLAKQQVLLEENLVLAKENQEKIQKIHAYIRRTFIMKIVYWVIVVSIAVGAYYIIQPQINRLIKGYTNITSQLIGSGDYLSNTGSFLEDNLDANDLLGDIDIVRTLLGHEEN